MASPFPRKSAFAQEVEATRSRLANEIRDLAERDTIGKPQVTASRADLEELNEHLGRVEELLGSDWLTGVGNREEAQRLVQDARDIVYRNLP